MKTKVFVIISMIILVSSCKKKEDSEIYSFSGKVQKGPFVIGTNVTLYELNSSLGQTGKSFITSVSSDDGSFGFSDIEMTSGYCLLTANGYCFSEIFGEELPSGIYLQSITDITGKNKLNINVMTHVITERVKTLVASGETFSSALNQAKSELLSFLHVTESVSQDLDELDISQNNEANAILLAFSTLIQRWTYLSDQKLHMPSELTELLENFRTDFKDNGQIDNQAIIDTLIYNTSVLNLIDVRENIETKYTDMGITTEIPAFEEYIYVFQQNYSDTIYNDICFPLTAVSDIIIGGTEVQNLLYGTDSIDVNLTSCLAAYIPFDKSLVIKIIDESGNYPISINTDHGGGWKIDRDMVNGWTLIPQRKNALITAEFSTFVPGQIFIQYFVNGETTPSLVKKIYWD
ncbi:MAG: hypothetical protein A2W91_04330 [Bacteroidetes bacterium GWF2_38_335]|nr:MAG: hypothetical protein A2W91_04330 [Bacteroidetes bacterium GWF2_38_335]HBS88266.1 hypothetical protein [Bacteroidales bacterium]